MAETGSGYEHPVRTHDHHALNAFVGRWRVDGALGDGTHVTGVETYEWLAGGFFLVNRWDREMGSTRHTGIGVVGTDPEGGGMVTRAFDNLGFARAYLLQDSEPLRTAIAVSISVVAVVTTGTLVGSLLPLGIKRIGLDPAVSSTPFIASLVDVLGLLVYFSIARVIFAQLL